MITYNHAPFIRQAVESVLMQETDFDFEIVIGEDCSTDETRSICRELASTHPDRIRLISRSANIGMHANFFDTYRACRGKYMALVEGDDYWTSRHKLASQAALLDANSECVLCFHQARKVFEQADRDPSLYITEELRPVIPIEDILLGQVIPTCSTMFHNGLIDDFPKWWLNVRCVDYPLFVHLGQLGEIRYSPECMADYRLHDGGIHSSLDDSQKMQVVIDLYVEFEKYLPEHLAQVAGITRRQMIGWVLQKNARLEKDNLSLISAYENSASFRIGHLVATPIRVLKRLIGVS